MTETRNKQPAEIRNISFDFEPALAEGDSVASIVSVTAAAGITASAGDLDGNVVTVAVSGGTTAKLLYRISCLVNTTNGERLEADVDIRIVE